MEKKADHKKDSIRRTKRKREGAEIIQEWKTLQSMPPEIQIAFLKGLSPSEIISLSQIDKQTRKAIGETLPTIAREKYPEASQPLCRYAFGSRGEKCPVPWVPPSLIGISLDKCEPFCKKRNLNYKLRQLLQWTEWFTLHQGRIPFESKHPAFIQDIRTISVVVHFRNKDTAELFCEQKQGPLPTWSFTLNTLELDCKIPRNRYYSTYLGRNNARKRCYDTYDFESKLKPAITKFLHSIKQHEERTHVIEKISLTFGFTSGHTFNVRNLPKVSETLFTSGMDPLRVWVVLDPETPGEYVPIRMISRFGFEKF